MKKFKFVVIFIFMVMSYLIASNMYAWSYTGHVLIAQIAYDNLQPAKKIQVDKLALIIFNELPKSQQEKINRQYPSASVFSKVAIMPDIWRKWKVATLFNKFHATLPLNLLLVPNIQTANWHYIDNPYPYGSCYIKPYNVEWAIAKLKADLAKSYNVQTKALLMILTEHFVGDIHQPLHTMTHIYKNCDGDRGGNDFCLKINKHGKCTKNLHSLWDSGVGYLKPHKNIQALAYKLEQSYPHSYYTKELLDKAPKNWANESYKQATYIYNVKEAVLPTAEYYQYGQMISKLQLTLAGYRLADEINNSL